MGLFYLGLYHCRFGCRGLSVAEGLSTSYYGICEVLYSEGLPGCLGGRFRGVFLVLFSSFLDIGRFIPLIGWQQREYQALFLGESNLQSGYEAEVR